MDDNIVNRSDDVYDTPMTTLEVDTTVPVTYRHMDDDSLCTHPVECSQMGRDSYVRGGRNGFGTTLGE